MNLPLVLDIALGLIFIFLILSLLASEIQELITTLLQWRAEHLKKSIENLLLGTPEEGSTNERFADDLYRSPLIKALNQEAKGRISRFFRRISQTAGAIYRAITGTKNVFGEQRSGPSYMPAETFAVALLQKLDVELLSQTLSKLTITQFLEEKLKLVEEVLESLRNSMGDDSLLENEFAALKQNLNQISADFIQRRTTLSSSLDQTIEQLSQFIDNTEILLADNNHCQDIIRSRLPFLRQSLFLRRVEPTLAETLDFIFNPANQTSLPPVLSEVVAQIHRRNPELPQQLKRNLVSLAKQAQTKANSLDEGVLQLQKEVEAWFDRSMERASGVYRRNAKGVAILIGFVLAAAANADTFHIVSRLSKDTILRSTVTQAADQVILNSVRSPGRFNPIDPAAPTLPSIDDPDALPDATTPPLTDPNGTAPEIVPDLQTDLEAVRTAVDNALEGLLLPIGWGDVNVEQQRLEEAGWGIPWLRRLAGWLITGIALSMGANFWYDLLNRVVRVRNTGRTRNSSTEDID